MSQVKITVVQGEVQLAVITYSEEYGPTVMAAADVEVKVEETDPRRSAERPPLRVVELPEGMPDLPPEAYAEADAAPPKPMSIADMRANRSGGLPDCTICDHPAHPGHECTWELTGPHVEPGRECGCITYADD